MACARDVSAGSGRARSTRPFRAVVEATEEAIINALVAARDMTGKDGSKVCALPHAALRDALRRHGRLMP